MMSKEKRLHIRLDEKLLNESQQFTTEAGISLNQLVRGLLHWIVEDGRPGKEPYLDDSNEINEREMLGCCWVGLPSADNLAETELEKVSKKTGIPVKDLPGRHGFVRLVLDYSERRAIRRDPFIDFQLRKSEESAEEEN